MTTRLRVKFCGFQRPQDVEDALRLGVDYVGFVFVAGSPRFLDLQQASEWLPGLDTGPARRVGVFRDEPARQVNALARRFRLDLIQLHGHEPRDYPRALDVPAFVVWRAAVDPVESPAPRTPVAAGLPPNVRALVVDAEDARGRSGGLGIPASDAALQATLARIPAGAPFFLSGGLTPQNVAERVDRYQPFGVDVSSGIECAPGRKDVGRMRDFMQAVGRLP